MAATIKIAGIAVDPADPCALATALEAARLKIIAGESVSETSLRSSVTGETLIFQAANLPALEREIAKQRDLCATKSGGRPPRRAIRAGFRYI